MQGREVMGLRSEEIASRRAARVVGGCRQGGREVESSASSEEGKRSCGGAWRDHERKETALIQAV